MPATASFYQDARYAIRALWRTPAFTATALVALAVGIGANTAIFSVVNRVLLKPLSYPDPGRIVLFLVTTPAGPSYGASATKFNVLRRQTQVFEDVCAYEYQGAGFNLTGGSFPEQIHGIHVTADYLRLLGAPVALGRTFTAEEDRPHGVHVLVMSYGLWQRRFGGDPHITGTTILLSGTTYTVVGVLGRGFDTELDAPPEVWLPFQIDPASDDHAQYFNVVARLRRGVSPGVANAQLALASEEFRRKYPNIMGPRDRFSVEPFADSIVSDVRPSLLVLAAAVSFVLLIACANMANLLLVRATGRRREIALRAAMGASRSRIIRQLLTESVVLSLMGGALGLAVGAAGVRTLLAANPGDIPRIGEHGAAVAMDWRVVTFTVFVSLATGVLFGLIPALGVSRAELSATLKESSGRAGTGLRQNRTRALLVVSETALALVLLIGAALLIRTFIALRGVDPGFDAHHILTMRMSLAGSRFDKTTTVNRLLRDGLARLESLSAVVRAGAAYSLPLEGHFGIPFNVVGRAPGNVVYDGRGWMTVSPGYFDIFKIPVRRGRVFGERDDAGAGRVAIINETLARKFWTGYPSKADPLADRVILGKGYGPEFEEPARQIVGVVGDVHDGGLSQHPGPVVYVPMAQVTDGITALAARALRMVWIVRTHGDPRSLGAAIERELREASGGLPVAQVRTMDEVVGESIAREDFNMTLLTIFGGAALMLAAIGIYGVMAYAVEQRRQELGIRMALGAAAGHVRNMLVWQGMRLALGGVAVGMAAAVGLTRLLERFLFGVKAWDALVFVTVPVVLTAVALLAVWTPAVRAARIDPVEALRCE